MRLLRKFRLALPFFIFMFIFILLWKGLSLHPAEVPSPLINKPAPTFQLPSLFDEKKIVTNKDFYGHVTLLNVWATWCYACVAEHEVLLQLSKNKEFVLFGLNYKDDINEAKKILETKGNPYRLVAVDTSGNTAIDWGVYGTPETFVIDKKGIIRYKHIGPLTKEEWGKKLFPLVKKLEAQ